jgi:hypothetical protein
MGQLATWRRFLDCPSSASKQTFALAHTEQQVLAEIGHSLVLQASDDPSGRRLPLAFRVQRS